MIPNKVRIGPIDFTVVEIERLRDDAGSKSLDGNISYARSEIRLGAELEWQAKRQTLWHEIIHGLMTQGHIETGEAEEQMVDVLAYGIVQVLRDNPELVKDGEAKG